MVCHPVTNLAEVTLSHVQRVVGRTFYTHDPEGRLVGLKLLAVTDMRPQKRLPGDPGPSILERNGVLVAVSALGLTGERVAIGVRPFGLLFLGPSKRPLDDDIYDLDLPWLPLHGLHLSPMGASTPPQEEGLLYEAVID